MAKSKFFEQIKGSLIEREVEDVYNKGISLYFPDVDIKHPFACDGFVDTTIGNKMLKLIIEYKLDEDFTSRAAIAKVLLQVLYYMKQFEINGEILPNVILVGDINECFVMHSNAIIKYLDEDLDWSIAPSQAYKDNAEVILKMAEDNDIAPFVYSVDDAFSFQAVAEKIKALAAGVKRYVHITEHNISVIYDYFTKRVIKKASKVLPNDLVAIFMGVILDGENYYQHPKKNNILVTPMGNVNIDGAAYKAYCEHFSREYTIKEKDKFAEISDRLIEDTNRRNKGEFFTPVLFVDYAHKMISNTFGNDWREKYVVWDNCAGSKNLTRDYRFKELYSSTLEMAELEISKRYNPEATSFQFDFLNDPLEKLPEGLLKAFEENKPILFFINPPYARAGKSSEGAGAMGTEKGTAFTMINEQMKTDKIGACSANLYAQFLYRILMIKTKYNLTNVNVALFSPKNFLIGSTFAEFRKVWLNNFAFDNAVQFNAGHFADVAMNWGISFSLWKSGETEDKNNFRYDVIDIIDESIEKVGNAIVYNLDNAQTPNEWVKDKTAKRNIEFPNISSGIKVNEDGDNKVSDNTIATLLLNANNVYNSVQGIALFSGCVKKGGNPYTLVTPNNFFRCTSLFAARKLVEHNWINADDEYLVPNTEHPKYKEFETDSIIYALFGGAYSQQSSLRQVEYKGKKWDIKNEFFFMSKNEILELADKCSNDECYMDARTDNERYVYKLLQGITLSPEAQAVLDYARELTKKTFKYRKLFDESHPDYQINGWDCGYYQLKALWKEYAPKEYEEFKELFKNLANKMRPMVYELGFLK